ncbi:U6 snRNA-associated Sm-like protein LSm1 [Corticium candelabrum]|uniref:U6 snRNA-associated Sm-like protein LSm1 n=1 Tax=Corticium candelabrum TaxID=121492 RepID=UPI002E267334|nr:U6 snRNA-associated Sm-like protein LSm1 [Corticium candelabrum]
MLETLLRSRKHATYGNRVSFTLNPLRKMSGYLPGTASLVEEIDKKLLVVLRDGRTLIGTLRSVDQFANLLLQDTIERIYVDKEYGDIARGIFIVRGENVVLLGEYDDIEDESKTADHPARILTRVPIDKIMEAQRIEQTKQQEKARLRQKILMNRGLQPSDVSDDFN